MKEREGIQIAKTASANFLGYVLGVWGTAGLAWLESGERGDRGENEDRDSGKSNDVGPVDHVQALDVIFTV